MELVLGIGIGILIGGVVWLALNRRNITPPQQTGTLTPAEVTELVATISESMAKSTRAMLGYDIPSEVINPEDEPTDTNYFVPDQEFDPFLNINEDNGWITTPQSTNGETPTKKDETSI